MKRNNSNTQQADLLKQRAEDKLMLRKEKSEAITETDSLKLLHELQVHKLELEMQNDELIQANEKAETISNKYIAFFDFAPLGYFKINREGKIIELNYSAAAMIGKDRSVLVNRKVKSFITNDYREIIADFFNKIFESGSKQSCESRFTRDNNQSLFLHFEGIITDTENLCFVSVADITEQKQIFENLKQSEIRLRELNASKDKFFSIISHDLRGPFNSIIGYSEILVEQIHARDYDGVEEYAKYIHNSSWRAMDLLTNLLEWSRSQTGRMEFHPENMQIAELIDATIETLIDASHQKSISIDRDLPDNITVLADRAMIKTTLRNLISNAIKFTQPHGRIVISARKELKAVIVAISDNGLGIDKNTLEKLFRIGEGKSSTGTCKETGTGLGLLLCKEFVEKHGGKIWIESELGKGTSVHFTVPNLDKPE